MADVKESIIRGIDQLTQFDLYELYMTLRDLPHYESKDGFGREGYFFDLDQVPAERVAALWADIQGRRKRINDVWSSEMKRNDFLGTLSVEFGRRRHKNTAEVPTPKEPEPAGPNQLWGKTRKLTMNSIFKKRAKRAKKSQAQPKPKVEDEEEEEEEEEEVVPELILSEDDDEGWGRNISDSESSMDGLF